MRASAFAALLVACGSATPSAAPPSDRPGTPPPTSSAVRWEVTLDAPVVALAHVTPPTGAPRFVVGVGQALVELDADGQTLERASIGAPVRGVASELSTGYVVAGESMVVTDVGADVHRQVPAPDVRALAAGYGLAFALGPEGLATLGAADDRTLLAEPPPSTRALLANGGALLLGDDAGISQLSLSSSELTSLAPVGAVHGLALDHAGLVVASVAGRGLVRVSSGGEATVILADAPAGPLAFDPVSRTLAVADGARVVAYDYLGLVGEDASTWAARDARPMGPFVAGGYALAGAEYWPYRGDREPDYPADVLWGFYPEEGVVFEGEASAVTATPAAVACAERSFEALRAFLAAPPEELAAALDASTSARFYLWVNDYSEAADPFPEPRRPGRLWYWQRDPAVVGRVPGYWKWETTLTQDGTCEIPDPAQAREAIRERAARAR